MNHIVSHTLTAKRGKRDDGESETFVAHSLTSEGHDASEDGSGRGTPLVAATLKGNRGKRGGCTVDVEQTHVVVAAPLTKGSASGDGVNPPGRRQEDDVNIVAFDTYNQSVSAQTQTLRDPNGTFGDALPAVAFHMTQEPIHGEEFTPAIGRTSIGMGVSDAVGVRRLTPVEAERLQALPDDWTKLDDNTPDSRRYSALGDAVTASVAEWIGGRLLLVHEREPETAGG